jgi:putative ABC transport system permease protein
MRCIARRTVAHGGVESQELGPSNPVEPAMIQRTIEGAWRDFRHSLRQLRRAPVFAITAIVTLALGIGGTTAVFTLVQQVVLRPLPVAKPNQLWRIGSEVRCCYNSGYAPTNWSFFSWDAYRHFRENTPAFESLAAFQVGQAELAVRRAGKATAADARIGEYVSGNFFATFGISAWRGRLFTDADDRDGTPPVAVMRFQTWEEKYGADPSVIGAVYDINGHPFTIIGVAAPGFVGGKIAGSGMPELWLPLSTEPLIAGATSRLENPALAWLDVIGRVRENTNEKTLEAQLRLELHQWLVSHAAEMTSAERVALDKQTLRLTPGGAGVSLMREQYEDGLRLLLIGAVCVLLVGCANIANLMLARGLRDRRATALRAAIGASRSQLMRSAFAQSITLGLIGATVGIAVAYGGAALIIRLAFGESTAFVPLDATPSPIVLLFALGLSVSTGVVFGVAPAFVTSNADPIEALSGSSRVAGGNRHRVQKTLVTAQAAMSLVLLSGAGMLGRSVSNLEHQNFGFDPAGRYLVSIDSKLSGRSPDGLDALYRDVEARLRAIPGVQAASPILYAPLSGYHWSHDVRIEGRPEPRSTDDQSSEWGRVSPSVFETLGIRVIAGRAFNAGDDSRSRPFAVINRAFAKKFFGDRDPIGQRFGPAPSKNAGALEIVGVVSDVRYSANVSSLIEPMYFVPEAQSVHFDEAEAQSRQIWSHYLYSVVIFAPHAPANLAVQVRQALAAVDPSIVLYDVRSYAGVIRSTFTQARMMASLAWLFGAVGLVIAAVGLYGVTSYGVEQRTSEIGIRVALGAERRSILGMVLWDAGRGLGIGLVLGIPAAIGAGRLISSHLFGVAPWDVETLAGSAVVLGVAALLAAFVPATRAARVSPMEALRAE